MAGKWAKSPKLVLWGGEYSGDGRAYCNPTDNDSRWPSVTSVLRHEDKSHLMQWAARIVAEKARDRPDIVMGDPDKVVDRLQYAHNEFRDERAEIGTMVHQTIQAEHEGSWDTPPLDAEQLGMMEQFRRFCDAYRVEILMSEFTVFGNGVMGTADALIRYTDPITGEAHVAIVDWKTSKSIQNSHHLQLAALANAEYWLKEVPEGTPNSYMRKGKVKAENSWWIRQEMPEFDTVAVLQIRDSFFLFEEVENLDLHLEEFKCYVLLNDIKKRKKEAMK